MRLSDAARDVAEALAFLTRLPLRPAGPWRGAEASWAWPLAGAVVGLAGGAAAALALSLGLPPGPAAALALLAQGLLTGALHEDGLADCGDALWGGGGREARLAAMRDSRVGAHGALLLLLVTLLRWSALAALLAHGPAWGALLAAGALGRWPMAALLRALPPARAQGLSRGIGRPSGGAVLGGAALALALALLGAGWGALPAALLALLAGLAWGVWARLRLGGQTGDVCGAAQVTAESLALAALAGAAA